MNSQWRYAAPPDDLTGLSASMNPQLTGIDVTLSANRSQGASSYEIYRSVEGGALNLLMVEPDPGSGSSFSVLLEDEPAESEITYRVVPVNVIKDNPLIEGQGGFQKITETTPAVLTGSIIATVSAQTGALTDLTASGYDDWCMFGFRSGNLQNRKNGANIIGNYYLINATSGDLLAKRYDSEPDFDSFSWTGGVNPVYKTDKASAIYVGGIVGGGIGISVPADTGTKRVTVWISGWMADAAFNASLSDASAPGYSDVKGSPDGFFTYKYVIEFNAASAGQSLDLSIIADNLADPSNGNVKIQTITLENL